MRRKHLIMIFFVLVAAMALAACGGQPAPTEEAQPQPTQQACPTAAPCPTVPPPPEPDVTTEEVPFWEMWGSSPHNDASAEAFAHWNEDDPAEVPPGCAKCHSTPGFRDFLAVDGTEFGVVEKAAPVGSTVECIACHNEATLTMSSVVFPSGIEITNLGPQARCMQCHQGRASTLQVNEAIANNVGEDLDTPNPDLSFLNIHYFAAAATRLGTEVMGGFEYEGKAYDVRFDHVEGYDTCMDCHSPHTLEIRVDRCSVCHTNVSSVEDLHNIRMQGSLVDYDGDGDTSESIESEISGMQALLYQAIQAYAEEVSGAPITYDAASHPYFFNEAGEAYASFTGRLLRAAYNYQTSIKDPGAFAHGGKYVIELLYDSVEDLNTAISNPVDLSNAHRIDAGHFASSEEAFRHWDEEDPAVVPATCSRCHSASQLPNYIQDGSVISTNPASGLNCGTCHNDLSTFTRYEVGAVTFPSGATLDTGSSDSNLCLNCHQGRESTISVNEAIARVGVGDDEISEDLAFRNPHYFAAGATLFGSEAMGAYQYEGQTYNGRFPHVGAFDTCVECHDTHGLTVRAEACGACHSGVSTEEDLRTAIRFSDEDFDGDGDVSEGIAQEVAGMQEALYAAILSYADDTVGIDITYDPDAYPYFFNEAGERYTSWTPSLLKAAYNYQWAQKDPGAFAHNAAYIMQVMYDSISDIGDPSGLTRPPVEAPSGEAP